MKARFEIGQTVEVSLRSNPEIPGRRGVVKDTNDDGEYYVTDGETFGHWYGGAGEEDDDSVFIVKAVGPCGHCDSPDHESRECPAVARIQESERAAEDQS